MIEAMTAEEKINILTKDFLERDASDNFVRIRRTGRLGWESTLPEDGAYSEYTLHPETQEDLIKNAYRMAGEMITVMDSPFKIDVKITSDSSCTDSQTVWVATKVFDDATLPVGKKLDTFLGLAIHEGCHLLYTDFKVFSQARNETIHALQNIIEDERIERECGDKKPGLANFLKASKYYYFDKYKEELERNGGLQGLDTFKRLMNTVLSFVRYPKALDINDLHEFADLMLGVREILMPYPDSTTASMKAAERIYDLMKQFMQNEAKKTAGGTGESSDKGESDKSGRNGSVEQAEGGQDGSDDAAGTKMDEGIRQMQSALSNITGDPGKNVLGENEQSETVKQDGGKAGAVCEGRMERGSQKGAYIEKAQENKDSYMESLSRVKQYIPAISRALKCSSTEYKLSFRGMRSGVLDTGKLAEAYQGVPTVYTREGEVRTDKVSVCILIDESGSMWGPGEMAARDTAILLNEAIGDVPNVDLYIYGHTATRSTTNLYIYREKGLKKRYVLGSTDSRAGNHDSIAIREAAARVRKYTKEKCLFFMISDGAPNESTELVRKAVKEVEKDGFNLVAISIDPYYDPSTMYEHNVNLTDLSTLSIELGKLVKKAVMDNTRKQINY